MTKYTLKHTWIPNAIAVKTIQSISSGEKNASQDFEVVVDGPGEMPRAAIKKVIFNLLIINRCSEEETGNYWGDILLWNLLLWGKILSSKVLSNKNKTYKFPLPQ